jgi:hypothetical protein
MVSSEIEVAIRIVIMGILRQAAVLLVWFRLTFFVLVERLGAPPGHRQGLAASNRWRRMHAEFSKEDRR